MKKTYWWRFLFLITGIIIFGYSWVASYGDELGLCNLENGVEKCILNYNSYVDSLGFFSISIIIISLSLFFITDKIFIKWLRFATVWIILSIFLIVITPEYSGGWISMNPDRESVSIWMGVLFVILSLGKIGWDSWREKSFK